ncbi:MAG: recombinase family protein [Patescibacteria group bacterium]
MTEKETPKYKYFAYVRKSTEGEERQAISIESQKDKVRQFFSNLEIVDILEEKHSAFKPYNRPVFEDMIKRIRKGEAHGIIAWHPDRLSRNEIDASTITYLVRTDVIRDLKFSSYNFDNSPEGIMMLQLALSQSQYSSSKLSRDVKRGLEKKLEMGWKPGTAPEGYLNNKAEEQGLKDIIVNKKSFAMLKKAFDLFLTGNYTVFKVWNILVYKWGYRTVKRRHKGNKPLGCSSFYRMLTNPFYAGYFNYKGQTYKGKHKPLITMEQYDRIQELLGRKTQPRPHKKEFAFTGMIKCGECGCSITAEQKRKKLKGTGQFKIFGYYHCSHKRNTDKFRCSQKSIEINNLENQITEKLLQFKIDEDVRNLAFKILDETDNKTKTDKQDIKDGIVENIAKLKIEADNLTKMRYRDLISDEEFAKNKKEIQSKIRKLENELECSENNKTKSLELTKDVFDFACYAYDAFQKGDKQTKKEILASLGSNQQIIDKTLTFLPFPWLLPLKHSTIPSKPFLMRLEPEKTLINITQKRAFAPSVLPVHGV